MALRERAAQRCFGGMQYVFDHTSESTDCTMTFGLYEPPQATHAPVPVLLWLSGLTCTHENFMTKAGAQRVAADLGLALLMPDTSPRGDEVPDDPDGDYDFGLGAGFYVDATEAPFARHYRMRSYLEDELPALLATRTGLDWDRVGISGHSMGGHGALTLGLRQPDRYRSVSAFAPICRPSVGPWGVKALTRYLGGDSGLWRNYDACALIEDGARLDEILVDQGLADDFLEQQLMPAELASVCRTAGIELTLREQPGYDHSFFFIATFIEDHLRWHAERLGC